MHLTPQFEQTLRRYALGDLEDGLRAELEELLITDTEAFEALGVIEDELIEEYLDGTGTAAERQSFEMNFLTSPERSRRVAFVRALRDRAGRPALAPAAKASTTKVWQQPAWIGLAAALVLSLTGNVWSVLRFAPFSLQPSLAVTQPSPTPRVTSPGQGRVPSFALAAGLLRAGGSLPRVTLPADAVVVQLRLELPGNDYPHYRAVLVDADGNEIWSASRLRTDPGAAEIVIPVPAALMPRGDYQLKLSGISDGGEPEGIATYAFRAIAP